MAKKNEINADSAKNKVDKAILVNSAQMFWHCLRLQSGSCYRHILSSNHAAQRHPDQSLSTSQSVDKLETLKGFGNGKASRQV